MKCFIKAGILNAEGETNAVEVAVELDSDISAVEGLAKETVAGSFDPPFCYELPDNWEEGFFVNAASFSLRKESTTMRLMMTRLKI